MRLKLAGLAAATLLAVPAAAQASTIEHSVTTISFEGNYSIEGVVPRMERFERWISADRARQVVTAADGTLRAEAAQEPLKFTAFDAVRDEIGTLTGESANSPRGTFVRTLSSEGGDIRAMMSKGWLVQTGETTFLGRPALTLATSAGAPAEGRTRTTMIVDAQNLAPYQRVTTGTQDGLSYTQTMTVESVETLPLAGNEHLLAMSDAGANAERVTFSEQARRILEGREQASKPKAAKKKKAVAKKKAKKKTRR
ncbi:hypothetical protein DVA67_031000 [Solirubrobacter sp. CPCC 204708]|uniref:Uncharacterized protein n=1 Tax=Solirubrobacter deserti TaxID=2282478 RepID=A0ABT4RLD7_9ACTN|nr:hypothetical protein [Solirubrobacter deserti]MBE2320432.1 hypothetical protein [Solirubrobacter deserti]MDA0139377.1 hypothetical protein [Solirubrobacter deserti]